MAKTVKDKAGSKKVRASTETNPTELISPEERQRMISEAAYLRAAQRGFQDGDPLADWLAAEAEINRALPRPQQQKEEIALYERLRSEIQDRLTEIRAGINAEAVRDAVERAIARLRETGGQTGDTLNRVAESVRKDIASAAERMGPQWEAFSDRSADVFAVWRDRGAAFLARAAGAVGEWLQQAGRRMERPIYNVGEMAAPGSFQCTKCGERLVLATSGHLPPCAKCRGMSYRRV